MDTVIPNQSVPEEHVSIAEDAKQTTVEQPAAESHAMATETTPEPAQPADQAEVHSEPEQTAEPAAEQIDFAEEEAQLASENAGIDLGEATPEEEEQEETLATDTNAEADDQLNLVGKSKSELVDIFAQLLETKPIQSLRAQAEAIKVAFYKLRRTEIEAQRKEFVETGGKEQDFVPAVDGDEANLKEFFQRYRKKRDEFMANLERTKEDNLKIKLQIIEELKELVNSDETLNHTFNKFRELQQKWRDTGVVPQANVKDLWETYNLHVENFYNFIKINKELRDLDLKKNYEIKNTLCEQAEALILEPSIVTAFRKLQKLHDEWRETGPVANEYKEALWDRFKQASSRINKQHQEYFEQLKAEQQKNLELKRELCVKTEELSQQILTSRKEWNKANDQLLEIQKVWKTIGFAPKKENTQIYERFRTACDKFFAAKRDFYAQLKNEMDHNLQLKTEICEAAEAIMDSDDWKKTTDELIALQKRWKETGAVARRYSDAIWKRFRAACDHFFERKANHFSSVDNEYGQNLERKRELLEKMKACNVNEGGYEVIKEFQRQWGQIGFVPIKVKDALQKEYKEVVDAMFATLRGSEHDRSMDRFRNKLSTLKGSGDKRLRAERERLYNKVRQLESDIALLENNIGFFSKSKNAEAMINDVKAKIDKAKADMAEAIEKVKLIDKQEQEQHEQE